MPRYGRDFGPRDLHGVESDEWGYYGGPSHYWDRGFAGGAPDRYGLRYGADYYGGERFFRGPAEGYAGRRGRFGTMRGYDVTGGYGGRRPRTGSPRYGADFLAGLDHGGLGGYRRR